jgi:hypothetical protein
MMTLTFICLYFLLIFVALFLKTREIKSPWLFYLRAFFPNWKFFHAIGYAPRLYVQIKGADQTWMDWQVLYPRVKRSVVHLFHNPHNNLHLANQNLVEHFVGDLNQLQPGADASQLVSYSLICKLARAFAMQCPGTCQSYRFEIRMEMPQLNRPFEPRDVQVMLASPELKNE